jgi:hypothetical protein
VILQRSLVTGMASLKLSVPKKKKGYNPARKPSQKTAVREGGDTCLGITDIQAGLCTW